MAGGQHSFPVSACPEPGRGPLTDIRRCKHVGNPRESGRQSDGQCVSTGRSQTRPSGTSARPPAPAPFASEDISVLVPANLRLRRLTAMLIHTTRRIVSGPVLFAGHQREQLSGVKSRHGGPTGTCDAAAINLLITIVQVLKFRTNRLLNKKTRAKSSSRQHMTQCTETVKAYRPWSKSNLPLP